MGSFYRYQLEQWLKRFDVQADSVLDVGGSQLPVNRRVNSWIVNKYDIFDLPNPHEVYEKPTFTGDLNKKIPEGEVGKYDIVFCLEVMEYIYNPIQAIKNLASFMKDDGELWITFPFVYPKHNPHKSDYLRYTLAGAKRLLEEAGLKPTVIMTRKTTHPSMLARFFSSQGMRMTKDLPIDSHEDVGYLIKAKK